MLIVIYFILCILVGLCGRQRHIGFIGTFILTLLLTPPLVLLILWLTASKKIDRARSITTARVKGSMPGESASRCR